MKKIVALLLAVMMLAACAFAEEAKGADVRGTGIPLTVYTNSGSSGRAEWLTEKAAEAGFTIAVLEEGAGAVQNRLKGEAANPIADVVYGLNAIIWNDLIANNIIISFDAPSWAEEVSAGLNDPNGYYYAIVKQACILAYDTAQVAEADAPKDWPDLWNNEANWGKYEVPSKLTGGTTRNVLAGIICRYLDPDGELGVSAEGWAEVEKYMQHGTPATDGSNLYEEMLDADNPIVMGQMWSSGVGQYDGEYGTVSGWPVPEIGTPYAVEGISIINGVQNDAAKFEEAKKFVEWFGSAQIQGDWAEKFDTMPANEIAAKRASEKQQLLCSIPAQDLDWAVVAANIDDWCEKIALEYQQ